MSLTANAVYNESLTITSIGKVNDSEKIDYELKSEVIETLSKDVIKGRTKVEVLILFLLFKHSKRTSPAKRSRSETVMHW
jgi:hypothetical protein